MGDRMIFNKSASFEVFYKRVELTKIGGVLILSKKGQRQSFTKTQQDFLKSTISAMLT